MQKTAFFFIIMLVITVNAQDQNHMKLSNNSRESREQRRNGIMLGFGLPHPSDRGLLVARHLRENLRLSFGFGELMAPLWPASNNSRLKETRASMVDIGLDHFMLETGDFRPTIGFHLASLSVEGDREVDMVGFRKPGTYAYIPLGVDWVATLGLQLGFGFHTGLINTRGTNFYFNTGYFW